MFHGECHAQPIHDCENVIQTSIYEWCDSDYEWLTSPPIFLSEVCRNMSSWISRQSFRPIKKFGFDLHTTQFCYWSRANMDWTIDIYGDNHNCQVESFKWTLNHTINGFHFNKYGQCHAQPIHDCENVIQTSIYEWCDSDYEWLTSPPISNMFWERKTIACTLKNGRSISHCLAHIFEHPCNYKCSYKLSTSGLLFTTHVCMIGHHEPPSLWTTVQIISALKRHCDTVTDFGTSFKYESSSPCWCKMSDILNVEISLQISVVVFLTFFFSSPRGLIIRCRRGASDIMFSTFFVSTISYVLFTNRQPSNIRSKSKYPVTKLFENAQLY